MRHPEGWVPAAEEGEPDGAERSAKNAESTDGWRLTDSRAEGESEGEGRLRSLRGRIEGWLG